MPTVLRIIGQDWVSANLFNVYVSPNDYVNHTVSLLSSKILVTNAIEKVEVANMFASRKNKLCNIE